MTERILLKKYAVWLLLDEDDLCGFIQCSGPEYPRSWARRRRRGDISPPSWQRTLSRPSSLSPTPVSGHWQSARSWTGPDALHLKEEREIVGIVVIVETVTKKVDNVTDSDHLPSIDVMRERRADLPVSRAHSKSLRGVEIVPVAVWPPGNYQDLQQKV